MSEKFDLTKMLKEIREDEEFEYTKKEKVSQDEIKRMLMEKQNEGERKK